MKKYNFQVSFPLSICKENLLYDLKLKQYNALENHLQQPRRIFFWEC